MAIPTWSFTVVIERQSFDPTDDEIENLQLQSRGDVTGFTCREDEIFINFFRESPTWEEVLVSAGRDIERIFPTRKTLRIET